MSGTITLGGHTYDNVSGNKFDEIKVILDRPEDKPKREVKNWEFGIWTGGEPNLPYVVGETTPKDCIEGFSKHYHPFGNLLEIVEEMKKIKDGKTECFCNSVKKIMARLDCVSPNEFITIDNNREIISLTKSHTRCFACQLLALAREET